MSMSFCSLFDLLLLRLQEDILPRVYRNKMIVVTMCALMFFREVNFFCIGWSDNFLTLKAPSSLAHRRYHVNVRMILQ